MLKAVNGPLNFWPALLLARGWGGGVTLFPLIIAALVMLEIVSAVAFKPHFTTIILLTGLGCRLPSTRVMGA
jgi:hypothetical protein